MRLLQLMSLLALSGALAACGPGLSNAGSEPPSDLRSPTGQSPVRAAQLPASAHTQSPNGITFHGGPVMLGPTSLYFIWYGDWAGSAAPALLETLARHLGGSPYYNINSSYFDSAGNTVSNSVEYAGALSDPYSHGKSLSDADVQDIVRAAVSPGGLPANPHGVYVVFTSPDVAERSGFCTQYCGFHNHLTDGVGLEYAFVGSSDRCPGACSTGVPGPHAPADDALASILAHELSEAVTDPHLDAWYSEEGMENGDKCAWSFGPTWATPGGGQANVRLGDTDFLIQQNWLNANGGGCALAH